MPQLFISSTLPLHSLSRKARAAKVGTPRPIHTTTMRAAAIFFVIQCAVAPPPPGDSGGSSGSSSSCATDGSSATYAETSATPASRASFLPTLFVRSRPRRQRHQHAHHRDEHVSEPRVHVHGQGRQRLRLSHRHDRVVAVERVLHDVLADAVEDLRRTIRPLPARVGSFRGRASSVPSTHETGPSLERLAIPSRSFQRSLDARAGSSSRTWIPAVSITRRFRGRGPAPGRCPWAGWSRT